MSGGGGEELATLRSDNGEQQEWRYGGRGGGVHAAVQHQC